MFLFLFVEDHDEGCLDKFIIWYLFLADTEFTQIAVSVPKTNRSEYSVFGIIHTNADATNAK